MIDLGYKAFCSSKNSYGNKTESWVVLVRLQFCSSKNSYGNKTGCMFISAPTCSVLAKIHMVTKLTLRSNPHTLGSVLAKIHMVTKHKL